MSGAVIENRYRWSLLRYERTVTVDVWCSYHSSLLCRNGVMTSYGHASLRLLPWCVEMLVCVCAHFQGLPETEKPDNMTAI